MKQYLFIILIFAYSLQLLGQEKTINVSENLTLTQLNKNTYVQTYNNSNGLVYLVNNEAVIISTPPSDSATSDLVNYIEQTLKAKVIACIVDHWHYDAMEGIDVLHKRGIISYSYSLTKKIAKNKGLPAPQNTFEDSLVLAFGDKKVVARYFGPSHSADDITVWLPDEQILFGSCGVKSKGGWVGNIADAYLGEWSSTIQKVKATYHNAETVVPGHGKHGDTSLLSYTIKMFEFPIPKHIESFDMGDKELQQKKTWKYKIVHYDSIIEGKNLILLNALIYVNKDSSIVGLLAPKINVDFMKNSFFVREGDLMFFNKESGLLTRSISCKRIILDLNVKELGMSIVIKEFVTD